MSIAEVKEVLTEQEELELKIKEEKTKMSKAFIKEQKLSTSSYVAQVKQGDEYYRIEVTRTPKIERFTLFKEDNVAEEVNIEDEDVDFGFLEGLMDLDDEDYDEDDLEEDDGENYQIILGADGKPISKVQTDNNSVIQSWKDKYAVEDVTKIPFSINGREGGGTYSYENPLDDLSDDTNELDDPLMQSQIESRSRGGLNKEIYEIGPIDSKPFWNNKRVVYDYLRYSENKNEMSKCVYGDEEEFARVSLLINKVLNFEKDDTTFVNSNLTTSGDLAATIRAYRDDNERLTTVTELYSNSLIKETYIDTDEDLEIEYMHPKKAGRNVAEDLLAPLGAIIPSLRYRKEVLKAKSAKDKNLFKLSPHMKTLVLPKIKSFEKFLNMEYLHHPDTEYDIADTTNKLIDYVEKYLLPMPDDDVIGYDAETEGLQARRWNSNPHLCVTHSFSWDDGKSIIVPIRMRNRRNINPTEAYEILKPVFETKNILAHNGAADVRFLLPDNIDLNLTEDTMHLIRIVVPFIIKAGDAKGLNRSLGSLCKRAFGYDMIDLFKYVFKPAGVDFDFGLLNDEYMIAYGCPDTDLMRRLWKGLRPKLDPTREYAYKQLIAYSKAMAILSSYPGIGVNTERMIETRQSAINTVNKVQGLIYEITGETEETLSLSSPKQVSNYLFNKLGAPTEQAKITDKGALSADKHVMEKLASITLPSSSGIFKPSVDIYDEDGETIISHKDLNMAKYPFCKLHRIQADKTKDITAFYNGILNNTIEGVYYPDMRVAQTDTYRDTDRIQITKGSVKSYLGAYNDDYAFISMDYATEEVRIAANLSEDMTMIEMLKDPEADSHTMVAAEMYNIAPSEVDGDTRNAVKSCNFGIIYGIQVNGLTKQLKKTEYPNEEELAEVQVVYDLYRYKRAEMLEPLNDSKQHVRDTGWIENAVGGWMLYPQIMDVDDYLEQTFDFSVPKPPVAKFDEERRWKFMGMLMNRSGNFPIQSLAAFQLKDAYIKFYNLLLKHKLDDKVFVPLTVHDEVGVIYHKTVDPYLLLHLLYKAFYSEMEYINKPKDKMAPLYIGVGFGTTWGNSKTDIAEIPAKLQIEMIKEFSEDKHPLLLPNDNHAAHFLHRIEQFLIQRLTETFADMLENKHFLRKEMVYRINQSVFLGKKMDETFRTNEFRKVKVDGKEKVEKFINVDKYVSLMCDYLKIDMDTLTIEDGEDVKVVEESKEGKITEFFFEPKLHDKVTVHDYHIQFDIRGMSNSTIKGIIDYLWTLHNPNYNYHNKDVKFIIGNNNGILDMRNLEGMKLLGIPANFSDVIDEIMFKGEYTGGAVVVNGDTETHDPLILFDHRNNYIIFDTKGARDFHSRMIDDMSKLISSYVHPNPSVPFKVWFKEGNEYVPTQISFDGIPGNLLSNMNKIYNKYGYVCEIK